jgi:TolB-like protein/Tfp pilus assembly protein PilF
MASLISGLEYDIFISYRQKDNKYDGWVSEFVSNLKGELESTFKEEVSVYFDINPHDGLLETHDVDASLRDKLKCAVFIPIVSRTYCDPKSFAWEYEFKVFASQAAHDQFGLKVRLPRGNVANRILPVQIHDLDPDDKTLLEKELGGVLRGIEFIYKSPGVNRPLLPKETNPRDNLNHTNYRDQINKVANAIKEIIYGMRNPLLQKRDGQPDIVEEKTFSKKIPGPKIIAGAAILLALITAVFILVPKLSGYLKKSEKSIAVLPFENIGDDKDNQWFGNAMTDEIIMQLYKINDFSLRPRTSVMQYRGTTKTGHIIGRELKVNYLIAGSAQRYKDQIRIRVNLIDAKSDNNMWSETYESTWDDLLTLQSRIAIQIADKLQTVLTPEEKKRIEKKPTKNPKAYNLYLQGRNLSNDRTREGLLSSISYFEKSVAEDPDYALAYAGLADTYNLLVFWDWWPRADGFSKAKQYALKALSIDDSLAEAHAILGDILLWSEWKWEEAGKELKLAVDLNPNCAFAHQYYSEFLDIIRKNKEAREQIDMALRLDPLSPPFNGTSALYYCNEGRFEESLEVCLRTIQNNPDYIKTYQLCIFNYLKLGNELKAVGIMKQYLLRDTLTMKIANGLEEMYNKSGINGILEFLIELELRRPQPSPTIIAWIDAVMGRKEETLDRLEKALIEHSSDLPRINNYYIFNDLRAEPRFIAIIKQMGLSEYTQSE